MGIPIEEIKEFNNKWNNKVKEYNIRACRLCTALIADSRTYGRMPNKYDSTLCECCEDNQNKGVD